jgi:hypothetical protein
MEMVMVLGWGLDGVAMGMGTCMGRVGFRVAGWVNDSVLYDNFGDTSPVQSEHSWYWRELCENDHHIG